MITFYLWLVVQIILESFPVSSSGHCLLFEKFLHHIGYTINHYQDFFFTSSTMNVIRIDVVEHFIHGVTVIVLALFFIDRWSFLVMHIRRCWRIIAKIIGLTLVADIFTAFFYLIFNWYYLVAFPLCCGFLITAMLLCSLLWCPVQGTGRLTWQKACVLGIVQGLALLPGISRFATTYVCARWLTLSPKKSFEISWLIAWPLLCAAFLNSIRVMITHPDMLIIIQWPMLVSMLGAGVVALGALYLVAWLAYTQRLWLFGIYMVLPIFLCMIL